MPSAWIHVAQYAVQYQCTVGRQRNSEFHESLSISLRAERLSSFLRSTRQTFAGLEYYVYTRILKYRESFVGAPFAHVDHANLLL